MKDSVRAIGGVIVDVLFIACLAVCGGVFNHMRGSGGGTLSADAFAAPCADRKCLGYWLSHVYTRLLMAVPMGALVHLQTRSAKVSVLFTFVTWASIFIGWGTYFSLGYDENGQNSRSGFLDWMLGRQLEGWDFMRRFVRDYAGMGVRGLLWTFPAGHFLYRQGYSWKFAVSGAMMAPIYYFCNWLPDEWTADNWQPQTCTNPPFSQDWSLQRGIAMAEFLFGLWLWLVTLLCIIPGPNAPPRLKGCGFHLFNALSIFLAILFIGSSIWYATVKQQDKENWGQTLGGLVISTVALIVSISKGLYHRQRHVRRTGSYNLQDSESHPLLNQPRQDSSYEELVDSDDEEEDEYVSFYKRQKNVYLRYVEGFFALFSVGALLVTIGFCFAALGWNFNTPRYCTLAHATSCP